MRKVLVGLLLIGCDGFPSYPAIDANTRFPDAPVPPDARVPGIDAPSPTIDAGAIDAPAPLDANLCLGVIDQRLDPCPNARVTECGNSAAAPGGQSLAQVFTPAMSGSILSLRLWMSNEDKINNRIEVAIADLENEAGALAKPSYRIEDHFLAITQLRMSDEVTWHDVAFATPPDVIADHPYAIFVRAISTTGGRQAARWVLYNDFAAPMPDWYPRGRSFARSPGAATWTPLASFQDFVFEVRVFPVGCR